MATTPMHALTLASLAAVWLADYQTPPPTSPDVVGESRKGSGSLNGYLNPKQLPNSLPTAPPRLPRWRFVDRAELELGPSESPGARDG